MFCGRGCEKRITCLTVIPVFSVLSYQPHLYRGTSCFFPLSLQGRGCCPPLRSRASDFLPDLGSRHRMEILQFLCCWLSLCKYCLYQICFAILLCASSQLYQMHLCRQY